MSFGDSVRAARLEARLTQEQLSERSGVSVRTIVGLESGRVLRPRQDTVRRLADACGLVDQARDRFERAAFDRYWQERNTLAEPVVPAQLPPDVLGFTGRDTELARLDADLERAGVPPTPVVIVSLSGLPGVGKTALAVHWAHRSAARFPDGCLYLNLRGYDSRLPPVTDGEAVRTLLDALGVPAETIPAGVAAQVGLYRTLLAGRHLLVLLDNARDAEQVRPLLPGTGPTVALVTAREVLSGLIAAPGARPLAVDALPPAAARDVLGNRLGPDRLNAEPAAVDDIVNRCGGLPLALAVIAARAVSEAGRSLADLATELGQAQDRLDPLAGDDPATNARAVFDCSYRALTPPAARLFRLLGLHPATDIAEEAAASLAGEPLDTIRRPLAELIRAQLVSRTASGAGHLTMHDLIRAFAAEQAAAHDDPTTTDTARRRVLDHYLHTAHAADRLVIPARDPVDIGELPAGVTQPALVDRADAIAWFTRERPALTAAIRLADTAGHNGQTWQLAVTALEFFDRWGHWVEAAESQEIALAAAGRLGDPGALALTHRALGRSYARLGRLDEAEEHLTAAAELFTRLDSPAGAARTRLSLAGLAERRGRYRPALRHAEVALDLFRAAGRPVGAGNALNSIGWYHSLLGEYDLAVQRCQEALALLDQAGDGYGRAGTWDSLGQAYLGLGVPGEAITSYRRAVELHQRNGDRSSEAGTLTRLGEVYAASGDHPAAAACWHQALDLFEPLNDPAAQALRRRLGPRPDETTQKSTE